MKKTIRIKVLPPFYQSLKRLLCNILSERYDVIITDVNQDLTIGSAHTPIEYLKEEGVKLFFASENVVPDFNLYDYAIGFDYIEFGDRYMRLPLYCIYPEFDELLSTGSIPNKENLINRNFCSMVVSNGKYASPIRKVFFEQLSKYKKIDSAGKYMNNMGGHYLQDKQTFISQYKFNIAFENSDVPGYTTEKLMQALAANTLPIYWGNPLVNKDFSPQSFINLQDFKSIKECVDYIVYLDQNDDKYLEVLSSKKINSDYNFIDYKERIWHFFEHIISQEDAVRVSSYGRQAIYRSEQIEKDICFKKYRTIESDVFLKRYYAFKSKLYRILHH